MSPKSQALIVASKDEQIRVATIVTAMILQLGDQLKRGKITEDELIAAFVASEKLGHDEAAVRMAAFIKAYRVLQAPDGEHVEPLLDEFDTGASYGRATGTVQDLRELDRTQADYDAEFARIIAHAAVTAFRHTLGAGRDTMVWSAAANGTRWRRVTGAKPCSFCVMLATRSDYRTKESAMRVVGRARGYGTASYKATGQVSYGGTMARGKRAGQDRRRGTRAPGETYHNNCVIGSTIVDGPRAQAAYRRWFEGEVVVIVMADGQELTITPNHPVLTARGWVDAGELSESDQLAVGTRAEWDGLDIPNEGQGPSAIQDVWGSRGMGSLGTMPVAAEDFHGDGIGSQGEVDVVLADSELSRVFDSAEFKQLGEEFFAWTAGRDLSQLAGVGLCFEDVQRRWYAAFCGVSGGDLSHSLCRCQGGEPDGGGFAEAAEGDTELLQAVRDYGSGGLESLCERLHRLARAVAVSDLIHREFDTGARPLARPRFDPPATEGDTERRAVHAELGGHLLKRLAGGVRLLGIRDLLRRNWSGHVYNLQTVEGWYSAQGIIVSNCTCTVVEVVGDEDLTEQELAQRDLYERAAEQCDADGVPRSLKNVMQRMRALDDGTVIHDAHKPKTQTGGAGGGSKPPPRARGMLGPDTPDEFPAFSGWRPDVRRSEIEEFDLWDAELLLTGDESGHGFHAHGSGKPSTFKEGWGPEEVVDWINAIIDNPSDGKPLADGGFVLFGSYGDTEGIVLVRRHGRWVIPTGYPVPMEQWKHVPLD